MIRQVDENHFTFAERLEEAERFHMGVGKVHETIRQLAADLDRAKIDYALIGAMALNAHGYRRETVDVDVLVRPDGLERFREEFVGRGYRPVFEGAKKAFRNTRTGVQVEFIASGEYPGDGKPKPVVFPDPVKASVHIEGIKVIDLPMLINLKLASGMTQPSRRRDLADVQELIRIHGQELIPLDHLDPYVKGVFMQLCRETVRRFRIEPRTRLQNIPNFSYFLRLMTGLERLRASMRWVMRIEGDESKVWSGDLWTAVIVGAGASSEVVRSLQEGLKNNVIKTDMIHDAPHLQAVWNQVTSTRPDELVRKLHRIRDQYFAHWDKKVMNAFLDSQEHETEIEPFIESDADGKFLNTRYLWPGAAFAYDFIGKPGKDGYGEEEKRLVADLGKLWTQTTKLVAHVLKVWLEGAVAAGEVKFVPVENEEGREA